MNLSNHEPFALLRKRESRFDAALAADLLAPLLDRVRADMQRELAERPGILLCGLSESDARQAGKALESASIAAWVMPEVELAPVPRPLTIRRGTVTDEGFLFMSGQSRALLPWPQVCLFDVAQILATKTDVVDDGPVMTNQGEDTFARNTRRELKTKWQEFIDIICLDPAVHLRIDRDDFRYAESGLPMHATPAKNFLGLAIALKTRCPGGIDGPGVEKLFDLSAAAHQKVSSLRTYENLLRWQVTLRMHGL